MRVLFDLTHPVHPYMFREVIRRLQREGHEVKLTARDKDILIEICDQLGFEVEVFGRARRGLANLTTETLQRQVALARVLRRFRPDVIMTEAGAFIAPLGALFRIPTYVFCDTEHATLSNLLTFPFTTCLYLPSCYRGEVRQRHVRYEGYKELAYLHPNHFAPDPAVLSELGLHRGQPFSIVRFVAWGAAHDVGLTGLTPQNKIRAIEQMQRFGPVLITSEGDLPSQLEPFRLRLDVVRIHDLMAHAALVFGESATMASEAAVLGVPSIYIDAAGRGYTDEQESRYGLVFNFTPERQDAAIEKAVEILADYDRQSWSERGKKLIADKIDVAELMYRIAVERPFTRGAA